MLDEYFGEWMGVECVVEEYRNMSSLFCPHQTTPFVITRPPLNYYLIDFVERNISAYNQTDLVSNNYFPSKSSVFIWTVLPHPPVQHFFLHHITPQDSLITCSSIISNPPRNLFPSADVSSGCDGIVSGVHTPPCVMAAQYATIFS